jgi:hypothetical protein
LTPYTQENELQLFSIVNFTIHGYDFRGRGEFLLFFKFCRVYSRKRIL